MLYIIQHSGNNKKLTKIMLELVNDIQSLQLEQIKFKDSSAEFDSMIAKLAE